jgi:hypothetical protein
MKNRKLEIITKLIDLVPEARRETVDQAMVTWWANIRSTGGPRLTDHGYYMLHDLLEIESWSVAIEDPRKPLNKKLILAMDQKLTWPYYISRTHVVFFSSRDAVMASLYGDLGNYIKNLN